MARAKAGRGTALEPKTPEKALFAKGERERGVGLRGTPNRADRRWQLLQERREHRHSLRRAAIVRARLEAPAPEPMAKRPKRERMPEKRLLRAVDRSVVGLAQRRARERRLAREREERRHRRAARKGARR